MLEQEEWEPAARFTVRLHDALERCVLHGSKLTVVLIASPREDAATQASRRDLSIDILSRLAQGGGGKLLFCHGHQEDPRSRESLSLLAMELDEEWQDSGSTVSARFDDRRWQPEVLAKPANPLLRSLLQATTP